MSLLLPSLMNYLIGDHFRSALINPVNSAPRMDGSLLLGSASAGSGSGSGTPSSKDEFWTPELEVKLAEKIRGFPCLYDSTHADWKNKPYRQDLWEMIAAEMHASAEQCRKKYKGLRDKAVREYRLGKESKWPAAEAMRFVLPLARIRHENRKPSKSGGGNYDDSNNYGFDNGSFDVDDNEHDEGEGYNHRSSGLIPGTTIPNIVPPIVQPQPQPGIHSFFNGFNHLALPKYDHNPSTSKRKGYDGEEYQYGDYYNQAKNMKLPSKSSSSVIISRPQPLPVSNGFNLNLNQLGTINGNQQPPIYKPPGSEASGSGNGNGVSSRRSSTSTAQSHQKHGSHGSSYYFGQYIASALDTLSGEAANDAKQKIQDILFKAQVRHVVHKSGSNGGSSSSGRKAEGSHPVVVFDETTGREQVVEVDKDSLTHSHSSKN